MRLYHSPGTRSTRVLWLLEEIGEPYDMTLLSKEDRQSDSHRPLHPLGRVPVLDDGEGTLIESAALCLHVADLHPAAELNWPLGTHERGLVYQWILYAMLELEMPIVDVFRYEEHPDLSRAANDRFREAAAGVEAALADADHLVGGRFSVADVVCGGVLGYAAYAGLLDGLPACAAYVERLNARPARRRAQEIAL